MALLAQTQLACTHRACARSGSGGLCRRPSSPVDACDVKRQRAGSSPTPQSIISPATPSAQSASSEADPIEWWTMDQFGQNSAERAAAEELIKYVADWRSVPQDDFWQRKSGKPVLSVATCRSQDGKLESYRGRNTEVSLPAGSLCAERAAIARAASEFRFASELACIAVLDPSDKINPLWPCEVCQSWLSKLRAQSPEISVLAASSSDCRLFAVRVNGENRFPPLPQIPPALCSRWPELVDKTDGTAEWPWESPDLVYVDGAWTFLHAAQQRILKAARAKGAHLLVGVHSDDTLRREFDGPILEQYNTRLERILQHRCVSSVLKNAPWCVTQDMIWSLGIRRVVSGSVCKMQDVGVGGEDPYQVARMMGILEIVPSLDETTEKSIRESHAALGRG